MDFVDNWHIWVRSGLIKRDGIYPTLDGAALNFRNWIEFIIDPKTAWDSNVGKKKAAWPPSDVQSILCFPFCDVCLTEGWRKLPSKCMHFLLSERVFQHTRLQTPTVEKPAERLGKMFLSSSPRVPLI